MRDLADLLCSPWAILPDRLLKMQAAYDRILAGEKEEWPTIAASIGVPLANEQKDYTLRDGGVAVLPIYGAIANKANMFTRICGGASAQMLTKQVYSMAADPRVRAAIIDGDTPGGSVFGIPELAAAVRKLADLKPTVTVSTGMLASAGYWVGSAANAVYASGPSDIHGSIGVVMTHNYNPRSSGQTTEITAGKYKRMGSDTKPLDKESQAYLQSQVDHLYKVFASAVSDHRGVSIEDVINRMADGRIFIGQQALDAGLIDGFATVDSMAEQLATNPGKFAARRKAVFALGGLPSIEALAGIPEISSEVPVPALGAITASASAPAAPEAGPVEPAASATEPVEENPMDPKEAAAKFAAESPEAAALLRAEGATAEIARIQSVRKLKRPGHEALIESLAFDGKTTAPEAAVAIIEAENARDAAAATARFANAPKPLASVAAESEPPKSAANGFGNGAPAGRVPSASKAFAGLNVKPAH